MKFVGKQIGNHLLVDAINSGSYGSVYRATHTILVGRTVAVKVLHSYLDSTKEREKFLQEARLLAMLKHRHILPIHDVGFSDELPYIVVEYAPGGSLRDHLKRRAGHPLPNEEALRVLLQIGQALTQAHQQNIIHRDLKPENILFNEQGEALLSDFGIATVVETSMKQTGIIGTPTYMAPEQFQGIVSKEVDQYALGCIAYELYTGRKVFEAPDFMAMAFLHRTEVPTPPSRYNAQLPPHIEQAILRALAKNRTDRHPDILAFLNALSSTSSAEERSIPPTLPSEGISIESWLSEGEGYLRLNRPREALAIFEQILQFIPVHIPALIGKGKSFSALERYEEAQQVFNEIVRLEPGKLSHRKALEMVRAQIKKKNGESSSGETGRPTPYPALELYNQGNAFYEQKQYEQALRTFAEAVRLEPGNASFHSGRGRALYTLKRYQDALQAFEKAAQLEPAATSYSKKIKEIRGQLKREEEARAQNKLKEDAASQYKQGNTFFSSKQYEKALTAFTEAVRLQPSNAEYQSARGRTLHTLKRYEEALAAFLNAASLDPKKGYYYKMQGDALYELKRYQDALQAFEKAAQLEPAATSYSKKIKEIRGQLKREEEARAQNKLKEDAASQYKQGNTFFSSKQYEKALTAFTEAVRLQPSNAEYQSARGRTLHTLKRYEQALAAFKEASSLAPEIHDHIKWQGDALYELKRYQEALQAFEKAARLQPNTVYYHKMQAESLHKLKRYQETLAAFEKAAKLEPSNSSYRKKIEEIRAQLKCEEETRVQNQSKEKATSLYKQGNTLSSSKQLDKALMAYWEAVRLQPDNPNYLKALAGTFDRLERYEEALAAFRDLAYLLPKDSTYLQMQAEMLWKLKRHQEALAMYEQAISMEPRRVYRNRLEEMHAQIKQQETGLQKLLNLFR